MAYAREDTALQAARATAGAKESERRQVQFLTVHRDLMRGCPAASAFSKCQACKFRNPVGLDRAQHKHTKPNLLAPGLDSCRETLDRGLLSNSFS